MIRMKVPLHNKYQHTHKEMWMQMMLTEPSVWVAWSRAILKEKREIRKEERDNVF